jgi:NAD+ kinase
MAAPTPASLGSDPSRPPESALRRLGLVVHPTRRVDRVLLEIGSWAAAHGLEVGQVAILGQSRRVAEPVEAASCDLLLALGGDGTALVALHAGAPSARPVLGVACGSIGALTSVSAERVGWALERIAAGRFAQAAVPGLEVAWGEADGGVAINDVALVRDGPRQVMVSITVDEVLYAQVAGDGVVVATALGSSAYTMAAGGPILAPGAEAIVVTPLAPHAGSCPPLVAGSQSHLALRIESGYGPFRCELDGRLTTIGGSDLRFRQRGDYARLVSLPDEEPRLTGLRRRGLVLDSPRVAVRKAR